MGLTSFGVVEVLIGHFRRWNKELVLCLGGGSIIIIMLDLACLMMPGRDLLHFCMRVCQFITCVVHKNNKSTFLSPPSGRLRLAQ